MPLSIEERKRRCAESVKRWNERNAERVAEFRRAHAHKPETLAKRRDQYQEKRDLLMELGLLSCQRRGRPRIYATAEEAAEAKRQQQTVCQRRRRSLMAQALAGLQEYRLEGSGTAWPSGDGAT
jgi:hypothetical protein